MKKVLVVDDDQGVCGTIRAIMEATGQYSVLTVNDGKAGLKVARKEKPDIILLDIEMPKMDGLSVLRELRAQRATEFTPVIMVTANDAEAAVDEAMYQFAEHYIVKPFRQAELLETVKEVLARHAQ